MKGKFGKKVSLIIVAILIISSLATVVYATGHSETLTAIFRNITIYRNNELVELELEENMYEPFIVNGHTYVPLRAVVNNIFDKEIIWDGANYRIYINDKPGQVPAENVDQYISLIIEKQNTINELNAKIAELEKEIQSLKSQSKSVSLGDLERELNRRFDRYKSIRFDIDLAGNKDDVDVRIYVDLDDYWEEWNALKKSDIEKYIEYIVDYILGYYKDADISGYIEDKSVREKLVNFYINTSGRLVIDHDSTGPSSYELKKIEDRLNSRYGEYKDVYFDIYLSRDGDDVVVEVRSENWDYLTKSEKSELLRDIYSQIKKKFSKATVYGEVYDEAKRKTISFKFNSKGEPIF